MKSSRRHLSVAVLVVAVTLSISPLATAQRRLNPDDFSFDLGEKIVRFIKHVEKVLTFTSNEAVTDPKP